ncbi:hypothetical protein GQ53DRAFT_867235 [Thozetella sp. PMI_491]|nr:hypothetical protein GQ53DRAFT_867235 [Thozetella sp. PMI_491]
MVALSTVFFLSLAALGLADPKPPTLTYLYSVNLTIPSAANVDIGSGPQGSRGILSITGGAFSGPKLKGKVGTGLDWGLTDLKSGTFSPDAIYILHTDDGANIMVTEKGHAPSVQILFETGSEKYSWINNVSAIATGAPTATGVSLDIWQVCLP